MRRIVYVIYMSYMCGKMMLDTKLTHRYVTVYTYEKVIILTLTHLVERQLLILRDGPK